MPVDFIHPDTTVTTAPFAGKLVSLTRQLRDAIDLLDEVKTIMDHNNDGTTFTAIETLFGLASGKGQTVYDLCNGSMQAISGTAQNSNTLSLINRVG
jgi:hypothetical protein